MIDAGHKELDDLLVRVEAELSKVYNKQKKVFTKEVEKAAKRFAKDDAKHKKAVEEGRETEQQYKRWREQQLTLSLWIRDIIEHVSKDITEANLTAAEIGNEYMPEAYNLGYDFELYAMEQFTEPTYLERAKGIPEGPAWEGFLGLLVGQLPYMKVNRTKDMTYNQRRARAISLQNLMGEFSVAKMKRLFARLYDSARAAMIRSTRTKAGAFHNIGRYYSAYQTNERLGIESEKIWLAILDSKTRHSHRKEDGERVGFKEEFSNGLRFPEDPRGVPSEVYNCRCDMLILPKGEAADLTQRPDKYGILTSRERYRRWEEMRDEGKQPKKAERVDARQKLEDEARQVYMDKNIKSLGWAEADYRFRSLVSGNTDAELRKFIKKWGKK